MLLEEGRTWVNILKKKKKCVFKSTFASSSLYFWILYSALDSVLTALVDQVSHLGVSLETSCSLHAIVLTSIVFPTQAKNTGSLKVVLTLYSLVEYVVIVGNTPPHLGFAKF